MTGLPAPGSWVMASEPSAAAASQTQPEPKRPAPLAAKSALKVSRLPHCSAMRAARRPEGPAAALSAPAAPAALNCVK